MLRRRGLPLLSAGKHRRKGKKKKKLRKPNRRKTTDRTMITSQEPITKETSTQAHHGNPEKEINMKDFQARLETSIGNIQAMVESWLPKELQIKKIIHSHPTDQLSSFDLDSSRPRNSKLGLGSIAPKQPPSQLTTSKLHSHLTKKAKKDGEHHIAEAKNSDNHPEQIDEEEDEEDSRTSTFGKKRTAPINESSSFSLLQPTPKVNKLGSSITTPPLLDPSKLKKPPVNPLLLLPQQNPLSSEDQNSVHPLNGDDDGHSLSKRKIKKLRKLAKARELAATRNKRS
ncbi:hypothetical protein MJO28_017705 [Puccinia striiformis f. sp. tritici]|nr:hypothetical protein MJO28_017705 [Puccinia striiformis f. sp. tritici]KAI7939553.1 hypothetical protein MJO29_014289 [Puccinia striiformis f. sp. tritici]